VRQSAKKFISIWLTCSATLCTLASAVSATENKSVFDVDVRGFGSIVATKTSNGNVGWRVQNQPINQARDYAGAWALNAESIIGVQADINSHQDISGSVQVIATNRNHGNVEPAVELAFLRYQPSPDWQFRLGRIWTPSFMNSETRYIGYSNTVFRNTNYTLYQITNLNGVDAQYSRSLGKGNFKLASYVGKNNYQLPNNAVGKDDYFELPSIIGSYAAWENESWLLRSSFTRINLARHGAANSSILESTVPALKAAYANGSCTICNVEADKWARVWTGVRYDVFTMAAKYNWNNVNLSSEYIWRNTNSTMPKATGVDVEVSSNIGRFTPYLSYTMLRSKSNNAAIFPSALTQFSSLNASYEAGKIDRDIITVGTKIDIAKNLSLRGEMMEIRFDSKKAGVGFAPTKDASKGLPPSYQVMSFAVDFLF
jgi:hypothetical protein